MRYQLVTLQHLETKEFKEGYFPVEANLKVGDKIEGDWVVGLVAAYSISEEAVKAMGVKYVETEVDYKNEKN